MTDTWIKIGIVGKANGLYGAFFLSARDEILDKTVKKLLIGSDLKSAKPFTVKSRKNHSSKTIIQTEEVQGRDNLDQIKGMTVWCLRSQISVNDNKEYLWDDVVGRKVLDQAGELVGEVKAVNNYGASDILEIKHQGRELSLPFVDAYFQMNFEPQKDFLQMTVAREIFDESWEP